MQHVTWVAFSQGRTLVGVDSSQVEFNAVNKTGGAKTVTLTVEQMPRHHHIYWGYHWRENGGIYVNQHNSPGSNYAYSNGTSMQGGSQPHPNLPPYKTLYIWRRSA